MKALVLLIHYAFVFYSAAVLLRFLAQWLGADFRNPISQALVQITNPLLVPLRRIIPGWKGQDLAALMLILLLRTGEACLFTALSSAPFAPVQILLITLYLCLQTVIGTYTFVLIFQAVSSWVNPHPYHPTTLFLNALTAPLLRPLRKRIPPLGGTIDITPLLVLVLLFVFSAQLREWFVGLIPPFWLVL